MVPYRNPLISLRSDAEARVIEEFHFALRDGGILLLGSAESPAGAGGRSEALVKSERIYRRVGHAAPGKPGQERHSHVHVCGQGYAGADRFARPPCSASRSIISPWPSAAPARRDAAMNAVSASSSRVAPASRARPVCTSRQ
jgi:hypothetical protein